MRCLLTSTLRAPVEKWLDAQPDAASHAGGRDRSSAQIACEIPPSVCAAASGAAAASGSSAHCVAPAVHATPAPPSQPRAAAVRRSYISCCGPAAVDNARLVERSCGCVCPMASLELAALRCPRPCVCVRVLYAILADGQGADDNVGFGRAIFAICISFQVDRMSSDPLPRFLEILVVPRSCTSLAR